jgi:hypothetical protein
MSRSGHGPQGRVAVSTHRRGVQVSASLLKRIGSCCTEIFLGLVPYQSSLDKFSAIGSPGGGTPERSALRGTYLVRRNAEARAQ